MACLTSRNNFFLFEDTPGKGVVNGQRGVKEGSGQRGVKEGSENGVKGEWKGSEGREWSMVKGE